MCICTYLASPCVLTEMVPGKKLLLLVVLTAVVVRGGVLISLAAEAMLGSESTAKVVGGGAETKEK